MRQSGDKSGLTLLMFLFQLFSKYPARTFNFPVPSTLAHFIIFFRRHGSHGDLNGDPNELKAATKIQSEIRGFLQRKHYNEMKKELREAATKIQASFRSYL